MELRLLSKRTMILIAEALIGWAPVSMMAFGSDILRLIMVITMAAGITIMMAIGTMSTAMKVDTMAGAIMEVVDTTKNKAHFAYSFTKEALSSHGASGFL